MKTKLLLVCAAVFLTGCRNHIKTTERLLALQESMDRLGVEVFQLDTNLGGVDYGIERTETERIANLTVRSMTAPRAHIRTRKPIVKPLEER